MIALASGLLALAGLFAERSLAAARRASLSARLGVPATRDRSRLGVPQPIVWLAAVLVVFVAAGPAWTTAAVATIIAADRILRRRRRAVAARRRDEQLADAVAAIAAGLRAGLSVPQALAYARDEAEPPLRDDLGRVVARVDVGVPVTTALADWADDLATEDALLLVSVLDLHRTSGGDLPAVLDGVVGTLRDRRAAQREVRALTAQGRLSGLILGTLPIGFFAFLLLTSRSEMLDAIATPLGRTAVVVGLGLELGAFFWIRRLLEVR